MILLDAISSDLAYAGSAAKAFTLTIAAVTALVAALKIFNRWQMGEMDNSTGQTVAAEIVHWAGACIFFLLGRLALEIML